MAQVRVLAVTAPIAWWRAAMALVLASTGAGAAVDPQTTAPPLTAEQVVQKNTAARGGVEAWRRIQTMVWVGHLESPESPEPRLPFVLEQQRPNRSRFEVQALGQRSLRVFDGRHGWKARPGRFGHDDIQPFTNQEMRFAREAQGIDGPLIDYQAKGNSVTLVGVESVEGRANYRITVRLPTGERHDVWIDAQTFLETRYDRATFDGQGARGSVSVFYRDYRSIQGLQIPGILEIGVGSPRIPDKMIIEKIALNPPLDDKTFARPGGMRRHSAAFVDIPGPEAGSPTRAAGAALPR